MRNPLLRTIARKRAPKRERKKLIHNKVMKGAFGLSHAGWTMNHMNSLAVGQNAVSFGLLRCQWFGKLGQRLQSGVAEMKHIDFTDAFC